MAADTEPDSIRQLWAQGAALSSNGQLQEAVLRFLTAKALLQLQLTAVEDPVCGSERAAAVLNDLLSKLQAELSEHISFLKDNAFVALQIDPAACTPAFVRKRYRRLALNYHPDKNPGVDTAALFGVVQSAYEALRDAALYRPLRSYEEFARQQHSRNASNVRIHATAAVAAKSYPATQASKQSAAAASADKAAPASRSSFSWRVLNEQELRALTTLALHELLQCWGFLPPDCSSSSMSRADMLQLYLKSTAQTPARAAKEAVPTVPQGKDAAAFQAFVSALSGKQVRALLLSRAVNVSDCIEREDYIVRACEAWGFTRSSSSSAASDVRTTTTARSCPTAATTQVPRKHTVNLSTERLRAAERRLGSKPRRTGVSSDNNESCSSSEKERCCADTEAVSDSAESTEPSTAPSAASTSAFSYPYMDAEEYSSDSDCSNSSSSSHEYTTKHDAAAAVGTDSDDSDSEAWDWVHTPRGTPAMPTSAVDAATTAAVTTSDSSRFVQQLRSQMPEQRKPYARSDSSAADAAAIQAEVHFWTQQHSTDDSVHAQQAGSVQSDAPAAFWFWGQQPAAAAAAVASDGGTEHASTSSGVFSCF
jgi:curved DNA-binding protein CbpA